MDAQDSSSARELQAQLCREPGQDIEQSALVKDAAGPGDPGGHGCVAFYQIGTRDCVGGGRMRRGLLAGQDVTVGVPAEHADAGQSLQQLKHLDRARAEQDKIPQRPPAIHSEAVRVLQHRA
jgi:hypothetical protein